jgi:hypothetical protein
MIGWINGEAILSMFNVYIACCCHSGSLPAVAMALASGAKRWQK